MSAVSGTVLYGMEARQADIDTEEVRTKDSPEEGRKSDVESKTSARLRRRGAVAER